MKVFLIILAVLVVIFCLILSISAEFTIIFDNGWSTKIRVLFIEKDIQLSKLLSFIVAPDKAGKDAAEKAKEKQSSKEESDDGRQDSVSVNQADVQSVEVAQEKEEGESITQETIPDEQQIVEAQPQPVKEKKEKKNPIQKILDEDGVVGILLLVSNLLQTVNSAATTLIKGLHIYSLYVKMIIGGGDAASVAEKYGSICGWYFPLKGLISTELKVDNFDDYLAPDFLAPRSEYELQFIGSISVGLLFRVLLKAGKTFVVNYIKNR